MTELLDWNQDIEPSLDSITPVSGGFTSALRGIVQTESGHRVFVKIGQNTEQTGWADKERTVYRWLEEQGYEHAPRLLAETNGGFAITDMSSLDWSPTWTEPKLRAALTAMDALAKLSEEARRDAVFESITATMKNGWEVLASNPELLRGLSKLALGLDQDRATELFEQTKDVSLRGGTLVHNDVRSDNFAYDEQNQRGYLVDWNWAELGNPDIDRVALLVNAQQQGFPVMEHFSALIDETAALWLAGFWLQNGTLPPPDAGKRAADLRAHQLESGTIALAFGGVR